jgi:hypothetical protein
MNVQFYIKKLDPDPQHSLQTSEWEEKKGVILNRKRKCKNNKNHQITFTQKDDFEE